MAKHAKPGVCPLCLAQVWKEQDLSRIINSEPIPTDQVIPALKARADLYRRIDAAIFTLFSWVDPLWLARDLTAGGALPSNLHEAHEHQRFTTEEDMPKKIIHWDRGIKAPACQQAGYLLETTRDPRLVTCKKCSRLVPPTIEIPAPREAPPF